MNDETIVLNYFKRIDIFLKDKEFERAKEYTEKILDMDPENAEAYLRLLYIEFSVSDANELTTLKEDISRSKNYEKILRYGTEEQKQKIEIYKNNIVENDIHHMYSIIVCKVLNCDDYSKKINRSLYDAFVILSEKLKVFSDNNYRKSVLLQEDIAKVLEHLKEVESHLVKWALEKKTEQIDKVLPNIDITKKVSSGLDNIEKKKNNIGEFIKSHKIIIYPIIGILVLVIACIGGESFGGIIGSVLGVIFVIGLTISLLAKNNYSNNNQIFAECKKILCHDYDTDNSMITFEELFENDELYKIAEEERKKNAKIEKMKEERIAKDDADFIKKDNKVYEIEHKIKEAKVNLKKYRKDTQKKYYYEQRLKNLNEDLKVAKKELFSKKAKMAIKDFTGIR